MVINLELNSRLYNDIEVYCQHNKLLINDYLVSLIRERHTISKYGDMNDLFKEVLSSSKVKVKKDETNLNNEIEITDDKKTEDVKTAVNENVKAQKNVVTKKKRELKAL